MIPFLYLFSDWALLILRLVLGLIMIVHGKPKLQNIKKTSENFSNMGFNPPKLWAWIASLVELIGGFALIVGFLTQAFALIIAVQFLVIIFTVKRGSELKGGYEFDLLILAASLILLTMGGGVYSLDQTLNLLLY